MFKNEFNYGKEIYPPKKISELSPRKPLDHEIGVVYFEVK